MANKGFSAAEDYFGTIAGLQKKTSNDGRTSSVAEAPNEYGDTIAHDVYGDVVSPSVEYTVVGAITDASPIIKLGDVMTASFGGAERKIMVTSVAVTTSAGSPPSVTISGVEVESGATAKRTYPVAINLLPRSKAQDVAGAFAASEKFTQISTTFSVDAHVQTVTGTPVASDASHGSVSVAATMTDGDGTGSITVTADGGFTITAAEAKSAPDASYVTRTATATKYMTGTEA